MGDGTNGTWAPVRGYGQTEAPRGTGSWDDAIGGFGSDIGNGFENAFGVGAGDPTNPDRDALRGMGEYGNRQYRANQQGLNQSIANLQATAAGQNSVSAEQLRQGLQQNLASQQSAAAGASPQNQAMAQRLAMQNMGRASSGLAGQQATAGLQERQQAQQQLGQLQLGQSGQNLQLGLGGYGDAIKNPQKPWGPGAAQGIASGISAMSDERLKTDVEDGDEAATKAMKGLKAFTFAYKDEKYGKGKQLGVMAQGLEKAGLGHAVIDTPEGKALNGGKLAAAIAAMMPGLDRRLSKLEDK